MNHWGYGERPQRTFYGSPSGLTQTPPSIAPSNRNPRSLNLKTWTGPSSSQALGGIFGSFVGYEGLGTVAGTIHGAQQAGIWGFQGKTWNPQWKGFGAKGSAFGGAALGIGLAATAMGQGPITSAVAGLTFASLLSPGVSAITSKGGIRGNPIKSLAGFGLMAGAAAVFGAEHYRQMSMPRFEQGIKETFYREYAPGAMMLGAAAIAARKTGIVGKVFSNKFALGVAAASPFLLSQLPEHPVLSTVGLAGLGLTSLLASSKNTNLFASAGGVAKTASGFLGKHWLAAGIGTGLAIAGITAAANMTGVGANEEVQQDQYGKFTFSNTGMGSNYLDSAGASLAAHYAYGSGSRR